MDKESEYTYIDIIGKSYLSAKNKTEKFLLDYYHDSEFNAVKKILQKFSFTNVVDLGCGEGAWIDDYKKLGFKKLIGIDISEERLKIAKNNGLSEIYCCNGKEMPFDDGSIDCLISNNVLINVIQDQDKLDILKESKRILNNKGIFIFSFCPTKSFKYKKLDHCSTVSINEMKKMVLDSGLKINRIIPCYFTFPRVGANPKFASFSSKFVFPITDILLRKFSDPDMAKVVYFSVSVNSNSI